MSFYAILKHNKEFLLFSKKEKEAYLLEHGFYESVEERNVKLQSNLITLQDIINAFKNKGNVVLKPKQELKEELYWFLLTYFNDAIQGAFVKFCLALDKECIAISKKKKRKKALIHYREIKEQFLIKGIDLIAYDEKGYPINHNIFKLIKGSRVALMDEVSKYDDLLFAYLTGSMKLISPKLINEWKEYSHIVNFESNLKIILFLNTTYDFEQDNSFIGEKVKEQNIDNTKILLSSAIQKKNKQDATLTEEDAINYLIKYHFSKHKEA